jgi:hypothetical protein
MAPSAATAVQADQAPSGVAVPPLRVSTIRLARAV